MSDVSHATDPASNAVIHAAAGTGKTWLLTSRIVRLLLAGAPPGAILAITFTRKAAAEMQERVRRRLFALASADDDALARGLAEIGAADDSGTRGRARNLYEQLLRDRHGLRATTFHAFCQDLLQRFPLEAEVPAGFALVETTAELRTRAWRDFDREVSADPTGPTAAALDRLLRSGSVHTTRQLLETFVDHRNDWWAYVEDADDALAFAEKRLRLLLDLTGDADPLAALAQDANFDARLARYAGLLGKHETKTHLARVEAIAAARAQRAVPAMSFKALCTALLTQKNEAFALKRSVALIASLGEPGSDELLALHAELTQQLRHVRERHLRRETFEFSRAWYRCGQCLLGHYQRLKTDRNLLDFGDLEWRTYRLLTRSRHAEWVQFKLDQRVDHVLVDEFQDTNPTQWRLLLPLLEEMTAGAAGRARSVFLVGDAKQSIYRFRRADPELFTAAREWLRERADARTFTQHVSWRSSPAIIDFVNLLFGDDGTEPGETEFRLPDFREHDTHRTGLWGHAELLPLIRKSETDGGGAASATLRDPLNAARQSAEDRRYRDEGARLCAKIGELIGLPVADDEDVRPLHFGDIMVLLRDRKQAPVYEAALRTAGIPYVGVARANLLECLEAQDIAALLRLLVAAHDDLALATVLRSPLFGATEDDLLLLSEAGAGRWHERLMQLSDLPADSALGRARRLLAYWHKLADRVPVHDLLDRIYCEGDVLARYQAATPEFLRARVQANLQRVLALALELDSGRYPSIQHFLGHLRALSLDDTAAPVERAVAGGRRVRLLTIHGAKGLEASVVFLMDAARASGTRDRGARALIAWPASEDRPDHLLLCRGRKWLDARAHELLHADEAAAAREETNLLYVALTRARQMLFVSGCEPTRGTDRGWHGFIEQRLRRAHENGGPHARRLRPTAADEGNFCAVVESGARPAPLAPLPDSTPAVSEADPRLLLPVAPNAAMRAVNPSRGADDAEDGVAGAAAHRGAAIHRMLELLTSGEPRVHSRARMRSEFPGDATTDLDGWWREACAVVDDVALKEYFDARHYDSARTEVPLLYRDGARTVSGVVDRLIRRGEEVILIDYKTHRQATAGNVAELAQHHAAQMRLYGAGARALWPGRRVLLRLLFTACRQVVEIDGG
jgi:ATP-dependent helicase/nuclease subunit A